LPPGTLRPALPDFTSGGTSGVAAERPLNHPPSPRPRRLPSRHFPPPPSPRRLGRLRMNALWPRASFCPCRCRPPRRNRVRCWRLVTLRRSTRRFGRSPCTKSDKWV
jgi:hypothetical protein